MATKRGKNARKSIRSGARDRAPSLNTPTVPLPSAKTARDLEIDARVEQAVRLFQAARFSEAERLLTRLIEIAPRSARALRVRSMVRARGLRDADGAIGDVEEALNVKRDAVTLHEKAGLHARAGDSAAASAAARDAIALDPKFVPAYALIARLEGASIDEPTFRTLEELAASPQLPAVARHRAFNALGRVHEARKDYDAAFEAFAKSNGFAPASYDRALYDRLLEDLRTTIAPRFFEERRGYGAKSDRAVFIVGAPRSGSALLARILAAHPKVDSVGRTGVLSQVATSLSKRQKSADAARSRSDFLQAISKGDAQVGGNKYEKIALELLSGKHPSRTVDVTLSNFTHIPLIQIILPRSGVIHSFCHPLDAGVACFKHESMHNLFAARLEHLAHFLDFYYCYIEHLVATLPDRIKHVCHEDVVTDRGAGARAAVDAIGVAWDDACLQPETDDRLSGGAATDGAVGDWRNYEKRLGPLIDGLGGLGALEKRYERFRALAV